METAVQDTTKQGNQNTQTNQGANQNQGMNKRNEQNKAGNKEGKVAREIETQTSKIPSDVFLWSSVAVMATSLTLKLLKKDHIALFVGQWAAPILLMGLYNKVVKTVGHDMSSPA